MLASAPDQTATSEMALREAMAQGASRLASRLALGLALVNDRVVQDRFRVLASRSGHEPLAIKLEDAGPWLVLGQQGEPALILRDAPEGLPQFDYALGLRDAAQLEPDLNEAILRAAVDERAITLLGPLADPRVAPSRAQMEALLAWAPMIEHSAYALATQAAMLLDGLRPGLTDVRHAPSARLDALAVEYWAVANMIGHLSLIATTTGADLWLAPMAHAFEWVSWTPSLPLVRERTLWLGAIGAHVASGFGAAVVDRYLRALSTAQHPARRYDALFGLVAIGVRDPALTEPIAAELLSRKPALQRSDPVFAPLVERMVATAVLALREPQAAIQAACADGRPWPANPAQGLLSRQMLLGDPATGVRHTLGLAALPYLLGRRPVELYPVAPKAGALSATPSQIAVVLDRAFGRPRPLVGATRH
jgi:hypothetical protein